MDHDTFQVREVNALEEGGNARVNAIYEVLLQDNTIKPNVTSEHQYKQDFVVQKYQERKWYSLEQDLLSVDRVQPKPIPPSASNFLSEEERSGLLKEIEMELLQNMNQTVEDYHSESAGKELEEIESEDISTESNEWIISKSHGEEHSNF